MTPEERQQLQELYEFMQSMQNGATITHAVDSSIRDRFINEDAVEQIGLPKGLLDSPLTTISDPSGGATVDAQARTAINTIIDRLQALGLIS